MGSQLPGSSIFHQTNSYNHTHHGGASRIAMDKSSIMAPPPAQMSKAAPESAYPSPVDEIRDTMAAPASPAQHQRQHSMPEAEKTLPSLREFLQRQPMSPSTSPQMAPASYSMPVNRLSTPALMPHNHNDNIDANIFQRAADPPLFSDRTTSPSYPLFSSISSVNPRGRPPIKHITPRRRKRTPQRAYSPSPLEPPASPYVVGMWARARQDPDQYIRDRIDEERAYWFPEKTQPAEGTGVARRPSSQGAAVVVTPPAKRSLDRQDSATQPGPSKRQKLPRGETQVGARGSPRKAPLSSLSDTVLEKRVDGASEPRPKTVVTPAVKRIKQHSEEPDRAYTHYDNTTPDTSTLDNGVKFSASWSGKPLNLDNDPDRDLLHDEEIRLASKLALTCARYLYLKRRFYAGRLIFARKSQLYNINAAQQQCKGQDSYGIVGADVNKTSSMWKAFNSVGWLEPCHMKPFL